MKTHTFSIVVGTAACNAKCPHCISKMTCSPPPGTRRINYRKFRVACNIVQQARNGLVNVLLTGKGEPMLFPREITEYLEIMNSKEFPLVDLQTNGTLIGGQLDNLKSWRDAGLTLVCISICHYNPMDSNKLMGIKGDFNFWKAVTQLQELGLAVRLNCTLLTNGLYTPKHVMKLLETCKQYKVDQLTVRDVDVPDVVKDDPEAIMVHQYAGNHKPCRFNPSWLHEHLLLNGGKELLKLPHGASVYDFNGQNICASTCVTSTTDPNDIRQVIFFPDGRIAYDWKYEGARIL